MANLTLLCPELLLSILAYLDDPSLCALSATSKAFPPYINPLLYNTVDWILFDDQRGSPKYPLLDWFRTLCERPDLAALVKRVNFTSELDHREPHAYSNSLTDSDRRRFHKAVSQLGPVHFEQELRSGMVAGNDDAVKALILSRLHNLEVLEIDYCLANKFRLTGLVLQNAGSRSGKLPKFGKLREVCFGSNMDVETMRCNINFELLFSVFHIPSVETIEMVLPEPQDPIWLDRLSGLSLPNLGTLRLLNSEASVKTLSKILEITPNLHTLEYNFVQDLYKIRFDSFYAEGHYDEWAELTAALSQAQETLRDLTISVAYHYNEHLESEGFDRDWVDGLWERRGCMGSLQSFTELQRLEIPLPVLLGRSGWKDFPMKGLRDALPSNLRELCLRDDFVDFYQGSTRSWTPWESIARHQFEDLDSQFENTVDCSPTIEVLRDLVINMPKESRIKTLTLKQSHGRHWPARYVDEVSRLCREANIRGIFLWQATNYEDEVIETTVYDPSKLRD